jgi:signal transduction histidine kinase
MLDATRESRVGTSVDIDLAALVHDAVGRWRGRAADRGADRAVVVESDGVVPVRMPVGSLLQVMDVLIGNAVTHGEGTITVTVCDADAYAEVRVADEGPHDRAVEGAKRPVADGAGSLATAAEITEALGGQLRLTDDPCTTFSLVVPHGRRETVVR